jgi:hypothetical protein
VPFFLFGMLGMQLFVEWKALGVASQHLKCARKAWSANGAVCATMRLTV